MASSPSSSSPPWCPLPPPPRLPSLSKIRFPAAWAPSNISATFLNSSFSLLPRQHQPQLELPGPSPPDSLCPSSLKTDLTCLSPPEGDLSWTFPWRTLSHLPREGGFSPHVSSEKSQKLRLEMDRMSPELPKKLPAKLTKDKGCHLLVQ